MCGIAGVFTPRSRRPVDPEVLTAMTRVIEHRGPDDLGMHLGNGIGLGHRRLSIIDLESGQQPIYNEDRTKAIVFNGEMYNFVGLREKLQSLGHRFTTRSDTEVILHAYEEYGLEALERLRGMFAFAIWDSVERTLVLARDRVGIKPLYYYWDGSTLLFGSEIKAILEYPGVDTEIEPAAIDDFLTYSYIPAPKSIFKRVQKVEPGHVLTVSESGLRDREYWDVHFHEDESFDEHEGAGQLLDKIRGAVSSHMVSDVPIGAFLSGGIDSSCVVGLMSQLTDQPVKTATIGFRESGYDESAYAREVSDKFGCDALEKIVDTDAAKILDTLTWHYDEPFADSSMVPTYYVSQVARERVKVCLSGDGGDENFGGYRRYRFDVLENRVRSALPAGLSSPVFGLLGRAYPKADWLPQFLRAKTLLTNLSLSPERAYFHSLTYFSPKMRQQLYNGDFRSQLADYDSFSVFERYFDKTKGWDPLSRIQYVDMKTFLVDSVLTKVDRASMAHGLEVRVPILDHEVVEHAARIPARFKLNGAEGKYILKKALEPLLPNNILYRPKMGFRMPIGKWFREGLESQFEDTVLHRDAFVREYLEQDRIRKWWKEHQRGVKDYSGHLWALLVLESWGQKFARRQAPEPKGNESLESPGLHASLSEHRPASE